MKSGCESGNAVPEQVLTAHASCCCMSVAPEDLSLTPISFCTARMMVYSGLTNKSTLLYDSFQTDNVPFEGLLSDGHTIRIEFTSHQPPAASAFNIRFEGEGPGGPPPLLGCRCGIEGSMAGLGLGRQKCDLLRLEKRPWLDCPLDPQRLPLWGWGGNGPCSHFRYENKEVERPGEWPRALSRSAGAGVGVLVPVFHGVALAAEGAPAFVAQPHAPPPTRVSMAPRASPDSHEHGPACLP